MSKLTPARVFRLFFAFTFFLSYPCLAEELDTLRLEKNVVPTFQAIDLNIDANKTEYTGAVRIDLLVRKKAGSFRFHADGLSIQQITLKGPGGAIEHKYKMLNHGQVSVAPSSPLEPGQYTLAVQFKNEFNRKGEGLAKVEKDGLAYTFTQFEAIFARQAFPCWDEPEFKIPCQMTLTIPENHLVLSNSPIAKESTGAGVKTVVFEQTEPMPSYLLALATGPYETTPIPGLGVPGRVVTLKGQSHLTAEAVKMLPPLLKALETYFKNPYPYKKLDLVAVPEFPFGAMENPGAVTIREEFALMDSERATVEKRRLLASILAHELAHMWFGDLVTMAWWDDLWLNEAFASWLGDKVTERVFPEFKLAVRSVLSAQYAMQTDALPSTPPIRRPVTGSVDPIQIADELTYSKGQAVLEMIERWLGGETFRKGMHQYIRTHRWGNAAAADFWTALSQAAGKDVDAAMSTFIDQPGVPLVECEILPENKIRLSQKRLLNHGFGDTSSTLWQIPVNLRYSDGGEVYSQPVLLSKSSQTVALSSGQKPAWVHPNVDESGYYRWQVAPELLKLLAAPSQNRLNLRERVGFLNNLSALLDAGRMDGNDYLETLNLFADDTEPEVLEALLYALEKVKTDFIDQALEEPFAAYLRRTLRPALERLGLERVAGENENIGEIRASLMEWLGKEGEDPEIMAYAKSLAGACLKDPKAVDPALTGTVLRVSARNGDEYFYQKCREKFETAKTPEERRDYLRALGSFHDPKTVGRVLQYVLDGPLQPNEIGFVPFWLASSPRFSDYVFEWMTAHYDAIVAKMPSSHADFFLPWLADGCSTERLKKAQLFFSDPHRRSPEVETELKKVADRVMRCAGIRERVGPTVAAYLNGLVKKE
ncbi:MAG: M1 family metallopeptidase [candidate division Zixibacteria bacterium]|nr:M1 family metallopeptidase [candidate division Zixibacteria bacterium]